MNRFLAALACGTLLKVSLSNPAEDPATILNAVERGDLNQVERWLATGPELNQIVAGESVLYRAAKTGQMAILERLLEAGSDPNQRVAVNRTALMPASHYGHLEIVERLLEAGADPRAEADYGYETFDHALEGGHRDIMALLIRRWVEEPEWTSSQRDSLRLVLAVINGDGTDLAGGLASGLDPDQHNHTGYAPLPMAVRLDERELVSMLLDVGADPNIGNDGDDEALPLNQAARGGNLAMINLLLAAGAAPDRGNARGYTALMLAANYGHADLVPPLINAGARPTAANRDNMTTMDFAIQTGNTDVMTALLLSWPDDIEESQRARSLSVLHPSATDTDAVVPAWGYSPLALAARMGRVDLVNAMLAAGADPDTAGTTGFQTTPLMDAARGGHVEAGRLLLEAGADVLAGDVNGDPAINWATLYGHVSYVELLLSAGADPLQSNKDGYTAIRTAAEQGHQELLELLNATIAERSAAISP